MDVSNAITPSRPDGTSINAIGGEGYFRPLARLATSDDAADVARLMIGFRDWQGREEPSDSSIEASVRRLLADPSTEYLLAGDPAAGILQLRFRHAVWTGTDDAHLEDLFVSA